jgi:hypothetical protein
MQFAHDALVFVCGGAFVWLMIWAKDNLPDDE